MRNEFPTITRSDIVISSAPVSGLITPLAARGTVTTLYTRAQKRFCLIVLTVSRESFIAAGSAAIDPPVRSTCDDCIAMSDAELRDIPTVASVSVGASLIPSPTNAAGYRA